MSDKVTCGVLHQQAMQHFAPGAPLAPVPSAFAAGFFAGQCEKVYLGACPGAMFRPPAEWCPWVEEALTWLCTLYGLHWTALGREYWVHRDSDTFNDALLYLGRLLREGLENTPEWHQERAWMCGIPPSQVDPRFHERRGWDSAAPLPDDICCGRCLQPVAEAQTLEGVPLCPACYLALTRG